MVSDGSDGAPCVVMVGLGRRRRRFVRLTTSDLDDDSRRKEIEHATDAQTADTICTSLCLRLLDPTWVESQTRAYIAWVNSYLSEFDESVTNLSTDLADGIRLLHLVELLEERAKEKEAGDAAPLSQERFSPFPSYHKVSPPTVKFQAEFAIS